MAYETHLLKLRGAAKDLGVVGAAAIIYYNDCGDGFFRKGGDQTEHFRFGPIGGNDDGETDCAGVRGGLCGGILLRLRFVCLVHVILQGIASGRGPVNSANFGRTGCASRYFAGWWGVAGAGGEWRAPADYHGPDRAWHCLLRGRWLVPRRRLAANFKSDDAGHYNFQHLPFGMYRLTVEHAGFTPSSSLVEIRSAVPREVRLELDVAVAATEVVVTDAATLIDPHSTGVNYAVGAQQIHEQQSAIPGRGLMDLVNMQPGWIFEANAVLHPRGSENQTLFVVDGVPMDENRSPGFAPDLEASEVESMSILTGDYPAEYGRKLGGVVEVTTSRDNLPGLHGSAEAGGAVSAKPRDRQRWCMDGSAARSR